MKEFLRITDLEPDEYYYTEEGYVVFTEKYHLKRGYCCQSGCRHCPFGFSIAVKKKMRPSGNPGDAGKK